MTVYVDDAIWVWQGLNWCHLLADDTDELHRFAFQLDGLPPGASAVGTTLTLTLVSGANAIEVAAHLD